MKREIRPRSSHLLHPQPLFLSPPFPPLLKAISNLKSPRHLLMAHTHLLKTAFLSDLYASTALTSSYMKLNLINHALHVFDEMPHKNITSLNAVVSGLLLNGRRREAFKLRKLRMNSATVASLLSGCETVNEAKEMHCVAVKIGVECDVYVATSAVSAYSRCGEIECAAKVFETMPVRNSVSYNAFMTGLIENGAVFSLLDVFRITMRDDDVSASEVALSSVLAACGGALCVGFGRQVRGLMKKMETGIGVVTGTALVDMYSKCGCWEAACQVFGELGEKNRSLFTWNAMIAGMMMNGQWERVVELFERVGSEGSFEVDEVSWNTMISGFSQLEKMSKAFEYFRRMQVSGVAPSLKSVTSVMQACADSSALQCGREVHGYTIRAEKSSDVLFSTSLIDMYMKCGQHSWTIRVFDSFRVKPNDAVFWNAMISGYGRNGENKSAFLIFEQMLGEKVQPDAATFISLLSMCSHCGLVEKGWEIFRMMDRDFGIKPTMKHYGCMIDLLGRSGRFDEAIELIQELSEPSATVFASLLSSCDSHLNLEMGKQMATKLSELKPENPVPFVILSKIYEGLGKWKDAETTRKMIDTQMSRKVPGSSLLSLHSK